jgi:hypothetical protein
LKKNREKIKCGIELKTQKVSINSSEIIPSSPGDLFGFKIFKTFLISSMLTSNSRVSFSSPY